MITHKLPFIYFDSYNGYYNELRLFLESNIYTNKL